MERSRGSNFWGITAVGSILLLDIAAHLLRPPAGFDGWDYFEWCLNAALVLFIWVAYRRQLRDFDRLAEQVEEKALSRVYHRSDAMIVLAYLFLLQALSHMHRH
jgi:hypothetical protein